MAEVLHLFQSVARGGPVRESDQVYAVENKGLNGCLHGRKGSSRQVLLMDLETLEYFGILPGQVKENITTGGFALAGLLPGQYVRLGHALLEVTKSCTPCYQMDEIRQGLREAMRGRRGMLCRVVESGWIRRGDQIEIVKDDASSKMEAKVHETAR